MFEQVEFQFDVPCNGCIECCTNNQLVEMVPGDDPSSYDLVEVRGKKVLRHKPNGDCNHLVREGTGGYCSIWDRRPVMCREFDCRDMVRWLKEGRISGLSPNIRRAGERLIQLGKPTPTPKPRYIHVAERKISVGR